MVRDESKGVFIMLCLMHEKTDTKHIKEALKVLGKDNLALIIHGSSFPAGPN